MAPTTRAGTPRSTPTPPDPPARADAGKATTVPQPHPALHGRFAPSPTGELHLGSLRTALLAWLFARSVGARFTVRLEDLDAGRVRPHVAEHQLRDLRAIGLDWDGPVIRQSERLEVYRDAIDRLDADGLVYPCFCTRAEVRAAASAPHGPQPAYPGTCRELSRAERARREASGRPPALRLRAGEALVGFDDQLLGSQAGRVDDLVVCRGDGTPAYNLAVVVDDAAQGIGQVVRGADLVGSTPRQLLLARLLGLRAPAYAHVPLVLGPDRRRLAKRHGGVTLADRRARGESAVEVRAWLTSSVGLSQPGEPVEPYELVRRFDARSIGGGPTVLETGSLRPAAA